MLTFFEYLRQRAFESVLTGAQEALELLENQGYFNKPSTSITDGPQAIEQSAPTHGANSAAKDSAANQQNEGQTQAAEDELKSPRPRLRGRSRRKGSRR